MRTTLNSCLLLAVLVIVSGPSAGHLFAQQQAPARANTSDARQEASALVLEAVEVQPANPQVPLRPNTLCKLRVRIRNNGSHAATFFQFQVRINGQELPVYKNYVYAQTIAPGAADEIQLYNFWTTESTRPLPADGQLRVEVTLQEAHWVDVRTAGDVNEHTFRENVDGLPVSSSLSRQL